MIMPVIVIMFVIRRMIVVIMARVMARVMVGTNRNVSRLFHHRLDAFHRT